MGCSRSGGTEHALEIEGERCGILTGHAYGLNKVINLICDLEECKANKSDKDWNCTHRLLLVRNPHGQSEWRLEWGSDSPKIIDHKTQIEEFMNELE